MTRRGRLFPLTLVCTRTVLHWHRMNNAPTTYPHPHSAEGLSVSLSLLCLGLLCGGGYTSPWPLASRNPIAEG